MVATARAVRVDIARRYAALLQVFSRRAVGLDRPRRRNMVSCYAIAQLRQHPCACDLFHRRRTRRHIVKVWSALYVSGVIVPDVGFAFGDGEPFPFLVALKNGLVIRGEHSGINGMAY